MRHLGFAVIFLLVLGICFAEIPHTINYQGKITNSAGVGLDGTYSMTFRIFNAPTGGSELWSETIPSVSIHKGLFDVVLGELNPIELPFDTVYWLQIEVEGEILSPRIKLSSVGYAYRSQIADSVVKGVSSLNSLTGNIRLVGEGG
ncbi:MAG TPA: hypothetical protein ENG11_02705, partial [candidate division Zixibacteria bacterium]|nr:hypothetical protein [candidate division Zixibacteria bacterium]